MTTLRFRALCAACVVWALAMFVRVELKARAKRAWQRIACAWMQCDEGER